jgi:hypothetical protein
MRAGSIIGLIVLGIILVASCTSQNRGHNSGAHQAEHQQHQAASKSPSPKVSKAKARVPAFQIDEASLNNLPITLSPDKFTGSTRKAYQIAREIPKVLAQLPCYCYCDGAHGHKSLHTCYMSDHSANCGICLDETFMAYRLYKEKNMSPEQIREQIMIEFSK